MYLTSSNHLWEENKCLPHSEIYTQKSIALYQVDTVLKKKKLSAPKEAKLFFPINSKFKNTLLKCVGTYPFSLFFSITLFISRVEKKPSTRSADGLMHQVLDPLFTELKSNPDEFQVTVLYCNNSNLARINRALVHLFGGPKKINLQTTGFITLFSHQDPAVTKHALQDLLSEKPHIRLVLSTSVLGMGFNSPHITRVIHFDPPVEITDYVQQIGRAGRAGQTSCSAVLYYSLLDLSHIKKKPGGTAMDEYCTTESCLRSTLMAHFGCEATVTDKQKCCSNCTSSNVS